MKQSTKDKLKETLNNELPPRRMLIELISELSRLLTGTLTGDIDHDDKEVRNDVLDVLNKSISLMSLVHESEVIEAMLHEEDRQHFNRVMTGLDTDTFHEILGEYRNQEGDAAADIVEAEFVRRQHLDNVKKLD